MTWVLTMVEFQQFIIYFCEDDLSVGETGTRYVLKNRLFLGRILENKQENTNHKQQDQNDHRSMTEHLTGSNSVVLPESSFLISFRPRSVER